MLQAMNTGHDGSMTTAHANTPEDLLRRLETMVMMSGMELTLRAIREQIVSAVSIVVQIARQRSGRRLVTEISWVKGLEKENSEFVTQTLFKRDSSNNVVCCVDTLKDFWAAEGFAGDPSTLFNASITKGSKRA
jgi:pilus assembly protein CpaF